MSETMKAMVYLGPGKKEVLERPKPTPQNSKAAVVKMLKTTIVGTDFFKFSSFFEYGWVQEEMICHIV